MIRTKQEIITEMNIGSGCSASFEEEMVDSRYIKINIKLQDLIADGIKDNKVTLHTWLDYMSGVSFDDKVWQDTKGLKTVALLVTRYLKKEIVYPLVLNKNFEIIDGFHRYAALRTVGIEETEAYYPID